MAQFTTRTDGDRVSVYFNDRLVLEHSKKRPFLEVGFGEPTITGHHGNFTIRDGLNRRIALSKCRVKENTDETVTLMCRADDVPVLTVTLHAVDGHIAGTVAGVHSDDDDRGEGGVPTDRDGGTADHDRLFVRLPADGDAVYGGGEQYSRLNMRGSKLPLWTSEQGVGRAHNLTTWLANRHSGAGGYWHSTYFPQPTFISANGRYLHFESDSYAVCDFSRRSEDRFEIWQKQLSFRIGFTDGLGAAVSAVSKILGRQPRLPEWSDTGIWLGLQGGSDIVREKVARARDAGVPLSGVWVQDWEGRRVTSFGSQLFWNWKHSDELYPDLPQLIDELKEQGVRFLGYINPFLAVEGDLYKEAHENGYCVKRADGSDYLITVTTFPAGLVDLTNPAAFEWIKGVIKEHMLGVGLSGWMADFGEYLPADAVLYDGDAKTYHNRYPAEWARANYEAVAEAGKLEDVAIFMRAGFTGSSRYAHSIWAGDQMVDWSRHDGLPSVIPAALSAGYAGIGVHHSDLGGYTTLFHVKRGKELFMRWAEEAAFTSIMRSHEGNRPKSNWQWDSDAETTAHLATMAHVYVALRPYRRAVLDEYYATGRPVQRPVHLHYPAWRAASMRNQQYRYLLGRDLFVAPVLRKGVRKQRVTLPRDRWVHLWTGREFDLTTESRETRTVDVAAPMGQPPVFYRADSEWRSLFATFHNADNNGETL